MSNSEMTRREFNAAAAAGADIVRVSCPDEDSTAALKTICAQSPVPIVADIHFHYRRAIEAAKAGACAAIVRSMTTAIDGYPHTGTLLYEESLPRVPAAAIATVALLSAPAFAALQTGAAAPEISAKGVTANRRLAKRFP